MAVKLEQIMHHVNTIPVLPTAASRVIELTQDPTTTVKELEAAIGKDPALTAAMLRQANSAYYGYARRISSIQDAIIMLGFQATQGLAMSAAVAPMLKTSLIGYEVEQEGLWKHSMLTALIAKHLCKKRNLKFGETAFSAGLLHDIGKLVISIYVEVVNSFFLEKVVESQISYVELEERVIGYSHATVGGFLAQNWNLPLDLIEGISYHHSPQDAPNYPELAGIIHIADNIASTLGAGGGVDSLFNPLQPEILEHFGFNEDDILQIIAEIGEFLVDQSLFT